MVVLFFCCVIVNFFLFFDMECIFECMVGFFFVKIDLSMLLYVCIQDLFNNEKGLFNMINFMKCNCKVVLLWVRSEFV